VTRCAADPLYDPSLIAEDLTMLYRPLFWTSFWFEDWLNSSDYNGGSTRILISSASAKTAFCLAYLIRRRNALQGTQRRVVGLTSTKNFGFTKRLALYDEVHDYASFGTSLDASCGMWIYVDVAGSDALNARVCDHLRLHGAARLGARIALGLTNISPSSPGSLADRWAENTPFKASDSGADTAFEHFFMPEWLAIRKQELSVSAIAQMQKASWTRFMSDCRTWSVSLRRVCGPIQVKGAYDEIVRKGLAPEEACIWSLMDETSKLKL